MPPAISSVLMAMLAALGPLAEGASAGGTHGGLDVDAVLDQEAQLFGHGDGAGGQLDARFGEAISMDGDTLVVGAPQEDTEVRPEGGAVYVYVWSGTAWTLQQRLVPPVGSVRFGTSVSLSGNTLAVGVWEGEKAYVYVRSGAVWTLQQTLLAADGRPLDYFGTSVAASGDTVAVTAPLEGEEPPGPPEGGAVYVFVRSGTVWTQQQKLRPSNWAAFQAFGSAIAVSGDTLAASAVGNDEVFVFERSGGVWTERQRLSDGVFGYFGASLSLSSDTLVVGTPDDDAHTHPGSATVFVRSGAVWAFQQTVEPADGLPHASFGSSVSVSGNTVAVGAPRHAGAALSAGAAYVYVRAGSTWSQQQRLLAPDAVAGDLLGVGVGCSGDRMAAGAPMDTHGPIVQAGSVYAFVRSGTTWTQGQKLQAPEGSSGDLLGQSVSLWGDTLAAGAFVDDTAGGLNAGSAYIFVRAGTGWAEQQKLFAPDGEANDWFGFSIAVFGDTVVVGAPQDGDQGQFAGSAHVFVRSGSVWTHQQKLMAPAGEAGDLFGYSVSISGDTIVIGSPGDNQATGAAYAFVRSGSAWTLQQQLLASDRSGLDALGRSVSVSGNTVVAGAMGDRSAYVFVRNGTAWTEQQKLRSADAASESFGNAVAVSGDTAVVGAYQEQALRAGAAYVFERSGTTWSPPQSLLPSTSVAGAEFGWSVAIAGDTVAVGAHRANTAAGSDAGSAFAFTRTGGVWLERGRLLAADTAPFDEFGTAVAAWGSTLAVGAPLDKNPGGDEAGSVYVFRLPAQYYALTPCRVADTRQTGMPLVAGTTRTFTLGGACLVPPDARAVAMNLTAVNPGSVGFLSLYPAGVPAPLASTLNFAPGRTRANNAVVPLGIAGQVNVRCEMAPGAATTVHFVLDVYGYFK